MSGYDTVLGHGAVRSCVQAVLDEVRTGTLAGAAVASFEELRSAVLQRLAVAQTTGLVRVINLSLIHI